MKRPRAIGGRREFERGWGSKGAAGPRFEELENRHLLAVITGRHVFYNQSSFDGNDPGIGTASDDAAIAIDKTPYRPEVNFTVRQLTTNSQIDQEPRAFGQYVIWQGRGGTDAGTDEEIFLFDGTTTTQLTENTVVDRFPKMSELGIFWERGSGTSQDIIYWDGASETNLTSGNGVFDGNASLSDVRIAWEQGSGNGIEIMSWTGGAIVNLSNNAVVDRFPAVDGDNVVWVKGSTPTQEITRSDAGGSPFEVDGDGTYTTTFALNEPKLSGAKTVWEGFRYASADATGREIYLDQGDGSPVVEVTNNLFSDFDPQIDGDSIVWWGGVFNDFQIYHSSNGSSPVPISTGIRNQFPQISGTNVVWQHFDGNDDEIYWWNGEEVIPLTDNDRNDQFPRIQGNHVAWQSLEGSTGTTYEIFDALLNNAPSDFPNITSYSRGLNGIMIDFVGSGDRGAISLATLADNFVFKVGNNNTPSSWAAAPTPSAVSVRSNYDLSGTDRVVITWANNAIDNEWLQVQVLPTANTGLTATDVFYWGNKIGDIGSPTATSFTTTAAGDATPIIAGGLGPASGITDVRDIDRSNVITAAGDRQAALSNIGAIVRLHLTSDADDGDADGAGIASALAAGGRDASQASPALPVGTGVRLDEPRANHPILSAPASGVPLERPVAGAAPADEDSADDWWIDDELLEAIAAGLPGP